MTIVAGDDPTTLAHIPTSHHERCYPLFILCCRRALRLRVERRYPSCLSPVEPRIPTEAPLSVIMAEKPGPSKKALAAYAANPAFEKAAEREVKQLVKKPDITDLLRLYGLYKTGCDEDVVAFKASKKAPRFYDFAGMKKLESWEKTLKEGLTPEQAQESYIAFVEELKEKYGFDPSKEPEPVGS
ncbi:hypothetical protein O1611_g9356 [Lasiodiplodia mahajangana]|uniref:Uncharacterized protein n=1 Tax=Lasiodiplodia mahajangana TaxID=1108764 RepID=A0ACC2JA79_9PEZI|nr:hypothetical protein O1611_g9356 [Lasiodiplodia mahajangana]